jgi:redox-sensitive bicupin YhaK (pirin superfamily)
MTAGKGIVHAEMPASFDEPAFGFQLWLNLDRQNKFCDPKYQEFKADQIPQY